MQALITKREEELCVKKKDREMFQNEEKDVLVIEDNTIYEIDMHCMKCKQKQEEWEEEQTVRKRY